MIQFASALSHFFAKHGLDASAYTVVLRATDPMQEHRLRVALLTELDEMNFGFRRAEVSNTSKIEVHGIKFVITTLDESARAAS